MLSVVLPERLKTGDLETVDRAAFRYATHYLDAKGESIRWPPKREWLEGGVDDLADAIEWLSLSERQLARGTEALEQVVRNAAGLLAEHAGESSLARVARDLHQGAGEQTERMAAAICVSAFVFHVAIEDQEHIPPVPLAGSISKGSLLNTWNEILAVNYWPIFSVARDVVMDLPVRAVPPVMNRIAESISDLALLGATTFHDLTGRMFQTLITDRKFLATFYTLPESACLLAELAVGRLDVDWSDQGRDRKAADCGLRLRHRGLAVCRAACRVPALPPGWGDDKDLHRAALMERVLTGLDIMPPRPISPAQCCPAPTPSLAYGKSQIHTMPYGIDGGRTHIGALDLLDSEHSYSLFATGESMGGTESDSRSEHSVTIEDRSCDLVIMNPPFTRPTNHEAGHAEIPVPSFAGFNTSHDEQQAMGAEAQESPGLYSSGHAGPRVELHGPGTPQVERRRRAGPRYPVRVSSEASHGNQRGRH